MPESECSVAFVRVIGSLNAHIPSDGCIESGAFAEYNLEEQEDGPVDSDSQTLQSDDFRGRDIETRAEVSSVTLSSTP